MDKQTIQSQTIDWLRFPLVVAVVFIHGFGEPGVVDTSQIHWRTLDDMDIYNLLRISISHVLASVAVPFFFLVAGYFFFYKQKTFDKHSYVLKLKGRMRTLFIPYLLWSLIYLLPVVLVKLLAFFIKGKPLSNLWLFFEEKGWWHVFWDCEVWGWENLNWLGEPSLMTAPGNVPLWFLRDLMVLVLLSPVVYWLMKHLKGFALLGLFLCYISGVWINVPGLTLISVFFFSLGAYLSLHDYNFIQIARKFYRVALISSLSLFPLMVMFDGQQWGFRLSPFFIVSALTVILGLVSFLVEKGKVRVVAFLSKSSFFIYLLHTINILWTMKAFFESLIPDGNFLLMSLRYFAISLSTVGCCLILYWFLQRFAPRFLLLLTGNRA